MPDKFPYAPLSELQRLRSYSRRKDDGTRETWDETCDRVLYSPHLGLKVLGKFSDEEMKLIDEELRERRGFGSFRMLWVGGTKWIAKPESWSGGFNCTSLEVKDWETFGILMDLASQGCGTGAVLSKRNLEQLPVIKNKLDVSVVGKIGSTPAFARREESEIISDGSTVQIFVGDSRQGWVKAYQAILELSSDELHDGEVKVIVDISDVRPKGAKLKGFGGVANPVKLPELFPRCAEILNNAIGRNLNSVEACLLIDEAASVIVAGSIRRSAGQRQADSDDEVFASAKENLWQQDEQGKWIIDPKRDALRMANHTRNFKHKPSLDECIDSVRKSYFSGEGAIFWTGESIARCNADLLNTPEKKQKFLDLYSSQNPVESSIFLLELLLESKGMNMDSNAKQELFDELSHRMSRVGTNPCG